MARSLFLTLFCVYLLFTSREPPWADAHVVYDTTQALVNRCELNVHLDGPPWFFSIHNGKKYGAFPLGNVVAMVPSYLAFRALRRTHLFPTEPLFAFTCHLSPALLMAAAAAMFYRLLRWRGASERASALLTLVLGLATLCFCYARSPYSEALQTLALVLWAGCALQQGERMTAAGMARLGVFSGVLLHSKLVYALVLPLGGLYVLRRGLPGAAGGPAPQRDGRRLLGGSLLALLTFLPFALLALWHNWLKTGSPWQTGYQIQEGVFSGDLLPALYGYTLSTGKSLFLYSPPLLLGVLGLRAAWQRSRWETGFVLAVIAVVMVFNAKFRAWHGDYCWGPRYLVPLTPLWLLLALPWLPEALARGRRRWRQAALALLVGSGLFAQLLGSAFYWDHYIRILIAVKDQTGAAGWFQQQLGHGHYIPQFSPLRGHLWLLMHALRHDPDLNRDAPWQLLVPQPVDLRSHYSVLRYDFWALEVASGPQRSPQMLWSFGGLLAGGALLAGADLVRRLRRRRADLPGDGGAAPLDIAAAPPYR